MSIAARALHGVNVCIIPLPDNNDRPLLLRPWPLKIISALLLAAKLAVVTVVMVTPSQAELSTITVARIVQLTNAERSKAGLSPLTVNNALAAAAKEKGAHMLAEDYFAHISPSGVTPWFWMNKHGYVYKVAGENLAIDFIEAEDAVAAWLASPTHKDNMLHRDYTETGVAVVSGEFQGGTSTIVVHMFGLPPGTNQGTETQSPDAPATTEPMPAPTQSVPQSTTPPSTPVPVPAQPLRTPRIALQQSRSTVSKLAAIVVEGDMNSEVVIAINEKPVATVRLLDATSKETTLNLADFPDGELRMTAVARIAGKQSEAAELTMTKDSTGPEISSEALSVFVAPLFDRGQAYVQVPPTPEISWQINGERITDTGAIIDARSDLLAVATDDVGNATTVSEVALVPQFETSELKQNTFDVSRRAVQLFNRFTGGVLAMITILLLLTIVVRMQVQQPRLLGQTLLVIFLAGSLLWL